MNRNRQRLSLIALMVASFLGAAGALTWLAPAQAQGLPPDAGPARTAKMFDLFCFSQLPDIEGIASVAKSGEFTELSGAELQKYQPQVPADKIHVWQFDDLGSTFTLISTKSKPDAEFKKTFPAFANSVNYACSLITPGKDAKAGVLKEMTALMERAPDESWDEARVQVDHWAGQTETLLVQVFQYSSRDGKISNLLSASAFVKE